MKKVIKRYQNDVADWLAQAEEDVRWAEYNLAGDFYSRVCFISQQIAEKGLKAYLLSQNQAVPKTHSLPILLKHSLSGSSQFKKFVKDAALLDLYYTQTRYPTLGPKGDYSRKEAADALRRAKEILNFIKKEITRE